MVRSRIESDYQDAVKNGDACRTAALRLLLAAIRDRDAMHGDRMDGTDDQGIRSLLHDMVRQCEGSVATYEREGKSDVAEHKRRKREILASYLPPAMNDDEMESLVERAIADVNARSLRDLGRTMARLRKTCPEPFELARARRAARGRLASGAPE